MSNLQQSTAMHPNLPPHFDTLHCRIILKKQEEYLRRFLLSAIFLITAFCTTVLHGQTHDTTRFGYQFLKFLQRSEIYGIGSARLHIYPSGVQHRDLSLSGNNVGIIGDVGFYGMQLWLGKFLMNLDFSNVGWQMPQAQTPEAVLVRRLGGVRFGYGYTLIETAGLRISPILSIGGGTMNFAQSQGNPFFYVGGDIEAAYSVPLTLTAGQHIDVLSGVAMLCAIRVGYGRNIASNLGETSSYDNVNLRLCLGIGLFSMIKNK